MFQAEASGPSLINISMILFWGVPGRLQPLEISLQPQNIKEQSDECRRGLGLLASINEWSGAYKGEQNPN